MPEKLEIKKDSRQIPRTKDYCADKKYNDVLYAYLQVISRKEADKSTRWFYKKEVNFSKLAEKFGLTRQTVSTRFKNLKELGLVIEKDSDKYELIVLDNDLAALVPYNTLCLLVDALSDNAISIYVYLLFRFLKEKQKPFVFTLEQLKQCIGICTSTRSNDNVITNILYVLQKIGLIDYRMTSLKQEDDNFNNVKTVYEIMCVRNEVLKIQSHDC